MDIQFKLDKFNGPLDLLLKLIETNKVSINDIPIAEITEQYLEYVKNMQEDMDIMSEFLVMAATLVNIKARMLLPKKVDEETGEEIDPRAELVERLLEYKKYKYVAEILSDQQQEAELLLFKKPTIPKEVEDYVEKVSVEKLLNNVQLSNLYEIFTSIVKKQTDKIDPIRSKFGKIKREEISLEEKMDYIYEQALKDDGLSFMGLFNEDMTKIELVVSFLAVLELIKVGKIYVIQDNIFDDIIIMAIGEANNGRDKEIRS